MKHDQIWKTVIWTFFAEFMELFLPDAARRLDFSRITLLNKEMFTDVIAGELREPDIVVEAYTHSEEAEIILVHIEVQSRRKNDVPYRMWEYYSLLRLRTKKPVLPLVLYLVRGAGGIVQEKYTESLFGIDTQTFYYTLEKENILAPALSDLMRGEKDALVLLLHHRFGNICSKVMDGIAKINSPEELDALITRVIDAKSLDELRIYLLS